MVDPVKSHLNRHTGESRYPEALKNTGFPRIRSGAGLVKHGMTKQTVNDFLRSRQDWGLTSPWGGVSLPSEYL